MLDSFSVEIANGEANKESNGAIDTKEQTEAMPNVK